MKCIHRLYQYSKKYNTLFSILGIFQHQDSPDFFPRLSLFMCLILFSYIIKTRCRIFTMLKNHIFQLGRRKEYEKNEKGEEERTVYRKNVKEKYKDAARGGERRQRRNGCSTPWRITTSSPRLHVGFLHAHPRAEVQKPREQTGFPFLMHWCPSLILLTKVTWIALTHSLPPPEAAHSGEDPDAHIPHHVSLL